MGRGAPHRGWGRHSPAPPPARPQPPRLNSPSARSVALAATAQFHFLLSCSLGMFSLASCVLQHESLGYKYTAPCLRSLCSIFLPAPRPLGKVGCGSREECGAGPGDVPGWLPRHTLPAQGPGHATAPGLPEEAVPASLHPGAIPGAPALPRRCSRAGPGSTERPRRGQQSKHVYGSSPIITALIQQSITTCKASKHVLKVNYMPKDLP